jgi:CheY-like chemotaxis protein
VSYTLETASQSSLNILVVDHHEDCLRSMVLLLHLLGHQAIEARNALDAIRLSSETPPDVVAFELDLPGLNGFQLARHFIQQGPLNRPLLIAVTSYGTDKDRQETADIGIDLHLVKPVDPQVLEAAFSNYLQSRIVPLS